MREARELAFASRGHCSLAWRGFCRLLLLLRALTEGDRRGRLLSLSLSKIFVSVMRGCARASTRSDLVR